MKNAFEYEDQLAALREELATYKLANTNLIESCSEKFDLLTINEQRLADAERRNISVEFDLQAAAKKLAACMDYPWEHMPEQGRASMREHAKAVIDAAITKPEEAKS